MALHRIRKGLRLPVATPLPDRVIQGSPVGRVALLADDYPGLRPRLLVSEGDHVERGQALFEDRRMPGVRYSAPGAGKVVEVNRGARRTLQSVVIQLSDAERSGEADVPQVELQAFRGRSPQQVTRPELVALLLESGLWTALRTRPYSKVPEPATTPHALFVTAIDTHPWAPAPELVVSAAQNDFDDGLRALTTLCDGPTYLCVRDGSSIDGSGTPVRLEHFAGPHPAGLPGLHMHRLAPVSRERVAWYLDYQDVIAIGRLLRTGRLDPERVVSIAGPAIREPSIVRTRLGACLDDLLRAHSFSAEVRRISGSILSGKHVPSEAFAYLGRYDRQVSVLREGREREFFGWLAPGKRRFSVLPMFLSRWLRSDVDLTTSTHGAQRAMVPIGLYERVMPMDILPTFLLRALLVGDVERAEQLGCLEMDEEDLALCTFVCPSKLDYGPHLRKTLQQLEAGA